MRTWRKFAVTLILTAFSAAGFTSEEVEFYRRRSQVMSDLHSGFDAVHSGKAENLDFRLRDLQVASLNPRELLLLRNTVFARYGYSFSDADIRGHFEEFPWYSPENDDVSELLDETDLWNIRLVSCYEDMLQGHSSRIPAESLLVGFWHGSASVGSGYSQRFFFFADGRFIFLKNSMDGASRLVKLSGQWRLDEQHLVLSGDSMVYTEGGRIVEPYGSCASDYDIDQGTNVPLELDPRIVFRLPLVAYTDNYAEYCSTGDLDHLTVPWMKIGSCEYWRFDANPSRDCRY